MGELFADISGSDIDQLLMIGGIASGLIGLLAIFRGYKMFRAVVLMTGFAIGMAIPAYAAYVEDGGEGLIGGIVVGIFTGFLGMIIIIFVYRLALVVGGAALGGLAGYVVGTEMMNIATTNNDELMPMIVIGGAIGAALLTRFARPVIKLLTAYGGASVAVFTGWVLANDSVYMLQSPLKIPEQVPVDELPSLLLVIFTLGTIGAAIQLSQQDEDKTKQAQQARQRQLEQQQRQVQLPTPQRGALPAPLPNAPRGMLMPGMDSGDESLLIRDLLEDIPYSDYNPVEQPDSGEAVPLDIGSADIYGQAETRASLGRQTRWIIIGNIVMWGAALALNGGLLTPEQITPLVVLSILWVGALIMRWMQYNATYNIRDTNDDINLRTDTSLADLLP